MRDRAYLGEIKMRCHDTQQKQMLAKDAVYNPLGFLWQIVLWCFPICSENHLSHMVRHEGRETVLLKTDKNCLCNASPHKEMSYFRLGGRNTEKRNKLVSVACVSFRLDQSL